MAVKSSSIRSIVARLAILENTDTIKGVIVSGNPDGVVSGGVGTIGLDVTAKVAYICFGNKDWREIT